MKTEKLFFPLIVTLLLGIVCVLFFLNGRSGTTASVRWPVAVIVENSSDSRWKSFYAGLEQAAEENNISLTVVTTSGISGSEELRSLAENELENGAAGLILEPRGEGALEVALSLGRRTSVELINVAEYLPEEELNSLACVFGPEEEIGRRLGQEIVRLAQETTGITDVGIVRGDSSYGAAGGRLKGLEEELNSAGFRIRWVMEELSSLPVKLDHLQAEKPVQVIAALENSSLELASEWKQTGEENVLLVGAGSSEKNIYYLDRGVISAMAVPDDFSKGYLALSDLAEHLNNRTYAMKNLETGYVMVTAENLFSEENERLLFPLEQ